MNELTDKEIERQDFVDTSIYELINALNPSTKSIEWDIEMIAEIRDRLEYWFVDRYQIADKHTFYPSILE